MKEIAKLFTFKRDMPLSDQRIPPWPTNDVFVISIREERLRHFRTRMYPIVPLVRSWSGVNGELLDLPTLKREGLLAKDAELGRGQVGCFFSHRFIWQYVADNNIPYALVMEDDAKWADRYQDARRLVTRKLAYLNQYQPNWDILLLARSPNKRENQYKVTAGIRKTGPFFGLFAYIVSSRGALKLMKDNRVKTPCEPVDVVVSDMAAEGTLEVFALVPEACGYLTSLESDTDGIV
jgi:GR25 family glycosyltransferase involved in LPS biosynthesis